MVKLINTRKRFTLKSTIGELTFNSSHICYILEPPDFGLNNDMTLPALLLKKEEIWNKYKKYTAIAPGEYPVTDTNSGIIELLKVKGNTSVFIRPIICHSRIGLLDDQVCGMTRGIDEVGSSDPAFDLIKTKFGNQLKAGEMVYCIERDKNAFLQFYIR